jgi:hypothetical protein
LIRLCRALRYPNSEKQSVYKEIRGIGAGGVRETGKESVESTNDANSEVKLRKEGKGKAPSRT